MSRYRRLLSSLRADGVRNIYSHQLARHAVVSAAQVRRDLMVIGYSGSPNRGYDVDACIESISTFLDGTARQEVVLVGVGNLGRAVLAHLEDKSSSVAIIAAFDSDPELTDTVVHGVRCLPATHMEDLVRDLDVQIAVITVPGAARSRWPTRWCAPASEPHQLLPVPLPAQRDLRRVHGHHRGPGVGCVLRPPRRRTAKAETAAELEPMVKKLESLLARSNMNWRSWPRTSAPASSRPASPTAPK